MAYKNLGWLNKKTSSKGNEMLIGSLKFDRAIPKGEEVKVMVNLSKPAKNGGLSVAELTEDEAKETASTPGSTPATPAKNSKKLF